MKHPAKRYSQDQLTKIFIELSGINDPQLRIRARYQWWVNSTDPNSLRLTLEGLLLVRKVLKIQSYEFLLPQDLTNEDLLRLERVFDSMYCLIYRKKIIIFEEREATMLTLHGNNIKNYLAHLESLNSWPVKSSVILNH